MLSSSMRLKIIIGIIEGFACWKIFFLHQVCHKITNGDDEQERANDGHRWQYLTFIQTVVNRAAEYDKFI